MEVPKVMTETTQPTSMKMTMDPVEMQKQDQERVERVLRLRGGWMTYPLVMRKRVKM